MKIVAAMRWHSNVINIAACFEKNANRILITTIAQEYCGNKNPI